MKKHLLNLGSIKEDAKDVKKVINQDWDVHWQLNIILAVFIRDSLKKFLKETPALPKTSNEILRKLFTDYSNGKYTSEEYKKLENELSDSEYNNWKDKIIEVYYSFDKYIHMNDDFYEKHKIPEEESDEFYEEIVKCGKVSFDLLKEVFDDLEW